MAAAQASDTPENVYAIFKILCFGAVGTGEFFTGFSLILTRQEKHHLFTGLSALITLNIKPHLA